MGNYETRNVLAGDHMRCTVNMKQRGLLYLTTGQEAVLATTKINNNSMSVT